MVFLGSSVVQALGQAHRSEQHRSNRWGVINGLCSSLLMALSQWPWLGPGVRLLCRDGCLWRLGLCSCQCFIPVGAVGYLSLTSHFPPPWLGKPSGQSLTTAAFIFPSLRAKLCPSRVPTCPAATPSALTVSPREARAVGWVSAGQCGLV